MSEPAPPGNSLFVQARLDRGIHTQEELAEAFQATAYELGLALSVSVRQVRRWESRSPGWPHPPARLVLQSLLQRPVEQLGFTRPTKAVNAAPTLAKPQDDSVKRREFMTGSLAVAAFTSLPTTPDELLHHAPVDPMDRLRDALVEAGPACGEPAPIDHLRRATAAAKRLVQACHYTPLARTLPALLTELTVQRASAGERCQSDLLSVDAYHVAASLLLKADDPASAWVAAEKAMMAARRSGNATAFATAARILTHAVAAVGHHRQAVRVAVQAVGQLQGGVKRSDPDRIAVFGSLLLRAAWAAAKADDRDTAELLLADAGRAAQLMDKSPNRRWTAFEPNNVDLHRVSIALTFGDAGRALDEARRVNVGTLAVAERRAVFWTDAARALFSCGRLEKAAVALLTAEREAPEEVRSRPVVRHLIGELLMRDQGGKVPLLRSLASRAQVAV